MIKCSSGHKGGGVLFLVKSTFISQAKPEHNTNAEILSNTTCLAQNLLTNVILVIKGMFFKGLLKRCD